jgi:hypothetical protein
MVKSDAENIMKMGLGDYLKKVQVFAMLRNLLGVPRFAAVV